MMSGRSGGRKKSKDFNEERSFKNRKKTQKIIDTSSYRQKIPRIIEYHVAWDLLNDHLRPLVTDPDLKNEFSGSIHTEPGHFQRNAKTVRAHSCSEEYVCMANATIVKGKGDSASFFQDIPYTYHTHPAFYYTEYGVKIAPPSGEDIGVFLRGCIEDKSCVHFVVSKEGIYVIIPNPCFIYQARALLERDVRRYNIALVGAEILGMQTHEYRDEWTPEQWLEWVRGRFVCQSIDVEDYSEDIRNKFEYHCECGAADIENFEREFKDIVRNDFQLSNCSHRNPLYEDNPYWTRGNWIDVDFKSWDQLQEEGGLHLRYSDF